MSRIARIQGRKNMAVSITDRPDPTAPVGRTTSPAHTDDEETAAGALLSRTASAAASVIDPRTILGNDSPTDRALCTLIHRAREGSEEDRAHARTLGIDFETLSGLHEVRRGLHISGSGEEDPYETLHESLQSYVAGVTTPPEMDSDPSGGFNFDVPLTRALIDLINEAKSGTTIDGASMVRFLGINPHTCAGIDKLDFFLLGTIFNTQRTIEEETVTDLEVLKKTIRVLAQDYVTLRDSLEPHVQKELTPRRSISIVDEANHIKTRLHEPEFISQYPIRKITIVGNGALGHTPRIHHIPDEIGNLIYLTQLVVPHNGLIKLPDTLSNLQNLKVLDVSNNKIQEFPPSVRDLNNLIYVDVSNNSLIDISPLSVSSSFKVLNASTGKYELPKKRLQTLLASRNNLIFISEDIGKMPHLCRLDLSHNGITALPESIGDLTELTKLSLHQNQITHLPRSIVNCARLQRLNIANNEITALPIHIGNLHALQSLDAGNNHLRAVPESFKKLKKMTYLDLSGNAFSEFPERITQLRSLIQVVLSNNEIETVPDSLYDLSRLQFLNLSGNRVTSIPEKSWWSSFDAKILLKQPSMPEAE